MDAEATAFIGAGPHQRTEERVTQRHGSPDKTVTTATGDLTIKIPKVRTGSFFPALLAPRRRIDVALRAVVMQAYVEGVSTRRVDDLVVAMGGTGISISMVSRICAQLDTDVALWRTRTLEHIAFPYVFLDATYCKVRLAGRVVSQAVVIATGVSADGRREVLGCAPGDSETEAFWTEFLRDLRERGLDGVQLVISDAHRGLVTAIGTVFQGSSWQRCQAHVMRNVPAKVSKGHDEMVAATIRTIRTVFAQPGQAEVRAQVDLVADIPAGPFPAVAQMLLARQGRPDVGVRGLPAPALAQDLEHQPAGTTQPRGQATDRRRRDPPQPRCPATAPEPRAHRDPRPVARQRPPLPVRGIHGAAQPTRPDPARAQDDHPEHDPAQGHRRYGIVALTRKATRDELHHVMRRHPAARPCHASPAYRRGCSAVGLGRRAPCCWSCYRSG